LLDISDNLLGDETTAALSRLLLDSRSIRTLLLTGNKLKIDDDRVWSGALAHNTVLRHLDLRYNGMVVFVILI
jgi:hypothetical protein